MLAIALSCTAATALNCDRFAVRIALLVGLAAALIGHEADQFFHPMEACTVVQEAAFATHRNQARVLQLFQVKGEGGSRDAQFFGEDTGREASRPAFNQQSEHRQTGFLRERAQRFDDIWRFHRSIFIEITTVSQVPLTSFDDDERDRMRSSLAQ